MTAYLACFSKQASSANYVVFWCGRLQRLAKATVIRLRKLITVATAASGFQSCSTAGQASFVSDLLHPLRASMAYRSFRLRWKVIKPALTKIIARSSEFEMLIQNWKDHFPHLLDSLMHSIIDTSVPVITKQRSL